MVFHCYLSIWNLFHLFPESLTKVQHLAKAIKEVLENAEQQILKEHPEIINGEIRDFMKVHNKYAKVDGKGNKILQTKIGGRTTYYTEQQKVFE